MVVLNSRYVNDIANSRSRREIDDERDDGPLVTDLLCTCRRHRRSQCLLVLVVEVEVVEVEVVLGWSLKQTGRVGCVVVVQFISTMLLSELEWR
jgi:hypothetical protein